MRKVSDMLREAREEQDLKLANVSRETKIKKEFLEEIENGNFERLPSESYALGFVKNYAKFLGLSLTTVVPLFRREYDAQKNISIIPEFRKTQHKFNRKFIFSARGFVVLLVVVIVAVYIFFQYSSLIFAPRLEIIAPRNGLVTGNNVIDVRGKTDPYAAVYIENDEVYVGLDGTFKKSVYEFTGDNKITIVAKNRFGKESRKVINVKVE